MCLLGLLLAACGGNSAVDKCDDLVDVVCDRTVECVSGITKTDCVQAVQQQLPCGSAKKVSASYDRCMDQLNSDSCDVLFPPDQNGQPSLTLPADCNSVILERTAPLSVTPNPMWEQASWAADSE
jgi:hypothetical protein